MVPTHPLNRLVVLTLLALVALGSCTDDRPAADSGSFCDAVDDLRTGDPFGDLAVASPGEMRDAFAALRDGAARIESSALPEAEVQAGEYAAAVDELIDQLAAAGYDPRALDNLAYTDATDRYATAASSLDNAADAACP